jgi:hypothetical protein
LVGLVKVDGVLEFWRLLQVRAYLGVGLGQKWLKNGAEMGLNLVEKWS